MSSQWAKRWQILEEAADSLDLWAWFVREGVTCCTWNWWSSWSDHISPGKSWSFHWRSPVYVGQWHSTLVARVWHHLSMLIQFSSTTQTSHSAAVLKISALYFACVFVLRRLAGVVGLLWGFKTHRLPLCGHWNGWQFGELCPGGCPLPSVFRRQCGIRGSVGRTGLQTSTRMVIRWAQGWSSGGPEDDPCQNSRHPLQKTTWTPACDVLPFCQTHALTASEDPSLERLRGQHKTEVLTNLILRGPKMRLAVKLPSGRCQEAWQV